MPADIEQLVVNLRENNGELVEALALLTGLLQKVAAKLGDQDLKDDVDMVREHIIAIELPRRDPPGCRLRRFEDLPAAARNVLGPGTRWRDFFNQQAP